MSDSKSKKCSNNFLFFLLVDSLVNLSRSIAALFNPAKTAISVLKLFNFLSSCNFLSVVTHKLVFLEGIVLHTKAKTYHCYL